jgi:flagellar biosynthesis protein FlhF
MEMYIEQGMNRMDCELKITQKYNRPFHIISQKDIRIGGFLGFLTKPGVQVEFYFSQPAYRNPLTHGYHVNAPVSWHASDPAARQGQYAAGDLEEEKKKVLAAAAARKNNDEISAASGRESSQQILDSLEELKKKIESGGKKEEHPAFTRAAALLNQNDFSQKYIKEMVDRMRNEMSLAVLDDTAAVEEKLLEWIGESISIYKEEEKLPKPKIMVLVGPTGVGKTTTISKLAAIYGISTDEKPAEDVRMITIDDYRMAAQEQLEKTGNIMRIPVSCVNNKQDLRKEIALNSEYTDLFLIDTIGNSPKDAVKLGIMKEILDGCPKYAHYHLAISANTKTSDIEEIMRQFEPFNYRSVVLTKMDETDRIGNVISALAEKRKSVSYMTYGQDLAEDISKASVVRFLTNLEGFKINREKIENRFPSGETDQFNWR